MSYDLNDAQPQMAPIGELIPDGTFAKVRLTIRPGGVNGATPADAGLLKASQSSDARMLDCEFTVVDGPHARRKFWQSFTVAGGKLDEKGQSIGWKISKSTFRAIVDSALGLDPRDESPAAKAKRVLPGLRHLEGIVFAARIMVEPASNPQYRDQNRIANVVRHPALGHRNEWGCRMRWYPRATVARAVIQIASNRKAGTTMGCWPCPSTTRASPGRSRNWSVSWAKNSTARVSSQGRRPMGDWTPAMVEARLESAADVFESLPEVKPQGYFNAWPEYFHSFADQVGQEPRMRRPKPSPRDITQADDALLWLRWLDPAVAAPCVLRANRKP